MKQLFYGDRPFEMRDFPEGLAHPAWVRWALQNKIAPTPEGILRYLQKTHHGIKIQGSVLGQRIGGSVLYSELHLRIIGEINEQITFYKESTL